MSAEELAPLVSDESHDLPATRDGVSVSRVLLRRLYVSHFLSTWNSRVFEFGAVIYLGSIFPKTLLPMSIYALTRGIAALLFAPAIGRYIDIADRLQCVRVSIVVQRLTVAVSCAIFFLQNRDELRFSQRVHAVLLGAASVLACAEKLCSIMNLVSIEKDWVIVIAGGNNDDLRDINAQMRRIDLYCKLLGPLFIAFIDGQSTQVAILVNFALNLVSLPFEFFAIARVYADTAALQEPKVASLKEAAIRPAETWLGSNLRHARALFFSTLVDFGAYFRHHAFLPSFAGAFLYLTVLSFSGPMITYLLAIGWTSTLIGVARTFAVASEILATFVAPVLMSWVGPIRAGLWFVVWQMTSLVSGTAFFCRYSGTLAAGSLIGGTIISRVGLRGFDLCIQSIVQDDVEADNRGKFSTVEAAWQSAFELLSFVSTAIFFRPEQFRFPVLISVAAGLSAALLFALFVRLRRGHLFHIERLSECMAEKWEKPDPSPPAPPRIP